MHAAQPKAPLEAAMVLRWGVLGSGKIARDFACSMLAVDGCEIVSVVR